MKPMYVPYRAKKPLSSTSVALLMGLCLVISSAVTTVRAGDEMPPVHRHGGQAKSVGPKGEAQRCQGTEAGVHEATFEGVQVETADIHSYEVFFEAILQAQPVLRIDHPQVDHLRGYCYRNVLVVVRQDLKTPRPTGWLQVNFAVSDVSAIHHELERALEKSSLAQQDEAGREKIVRLRLKPDVPRSNCRAIRLEVNGPEGFLVGFDQFKEGSCKTEEQPPEGGQASQKAIR